MWHPAIVSDNLVRHQDLLADLAKSREYECFYSLSCQSYWIGIVNSLAIVACQEISRVVKWKQVSHILSVFLEWQF
jgi:hypothetical protein